MSAIWGCLSKTKNINISTFIQNSASYITRHGNEKLGVCSNKYIGFAHNQLFTTPESLNEIQPIIDQTTGLTLTADVRIDNRTELITTLETNSDITDAELILLSYKKWDIKCINYIVGDFSFAIWDNNNKKLFCARDRLGIKPFFYINDHEGFYFASEVLPLTKLNAKKMQPNIDAMMKFIDSSPRIGDTMYKNIFSLPAGRILLIDNNTLSIKRYWFPENIPINTKISFDESVKTFQTLFKEAVKCRLRSAFPIGFELSGGIDSSSVVCIADKIPTTQSKTAFINRFGNYQCDEGLYSTEVKKKVQMNCIELKADKMDYINNYSMDFNYDKSPDWPIFATFTQKFPMTKMMKEKGIKVVLTGQGGDQVLTGNYYVLYDYIRSFKWLKFISLWRSIHYNKKAIFKYSILIPFAEHCKNKISKLLLYLKYNKNDYIVPSNVKKELDFSSYPLAQLSDLQDVFGNTHHHFMDNNAYHCAGIDNIEFRHPFYDSRLIEFSLSLPSEYKLWGDEGKKILREAMKDILPEKIRTRQDKAEMSEVLHDQIEAIDLDDFWKMHYIVDLGIIKYSDLQNTISMYKSRNSGISKLWRLINLEYWYRINFILN